MFAKAAYLYLLRVPIIIGLVLFIFPIAAIYSPLCALFENLFDIDGVGTFLSTVLALITAWSILLTSRLVLINGATRFETAPAGAVAALSARRVWWVLILAMPALFAQFTRLSHFAQRDANGNPSGLAGLAAGHAGMILLGASAAYILAYVGVLLAVLLAPIGTQHDTANTFPAFPFMRNWLADADTKNPLGNVWNSVGPWLLAHLRPGLRAGLLDGQGYPLSGIWLAAAFASITLALYQSIDIYKRAHLGEPVSPFPAFFFVLWLLLNANWVLSFFAFLLDRWRIPLLVPFAILFLVASWIPSNDHYFEVRPGATIRPVPPAAVLDKRLEKEQLAQGRKIIVVASAGGGIQAAAWTARVLTGLQRDSLDPASIDGAKKADFASDLTAISSVSGGAVGAMFFLNQYDPASQGFALPTDRLDEVVNMAAGGTLDDTAWSLVYHDIPRLYTPFTINPELDRGYLLEQSWRNRGNVNAYLSNWQEGVLAGWRPVTIFNSTFAESGEPLLFSTSEIKDRDKAPHRWNFFKKYQDTNIPIVTAVRLAATFPFVSPAARATTSKPENHVVDGGYYDNYGVTSLAEWLYQAVENRADLPPVLVIQILAFPDEGEKQVTRNQSAFFQLYAPLQALFGVRSSSQLIRDKDELERLKYRWGSNVVLASFPFTGKDAPLSWQMNRKQRAEIDQQWRQYEGDEGVGHEQFLKVRCFINEERPGCSAAREAIKGR